MSFVAVAETFFSFLSYIASVHSAVQTNQETNLKTIHWQKLPWILCGLAVHESERARAIARRAMQMFDDEQNIDALITFGRRHPLSQRFLKRDQPLRGLLEQFVQGADLTADAELEPLREWVGALRLIRIVERETEATGLHASY